MGTGRQAESAHLFVLSRKVVHVAGIEQWTLRIPDLVQQPLCILAVDCLNALFGTWPSYQLFPLHLAAKR